MALTENEIQPRILAYFILSELSSDPKVIGFDHSGSRPGEMRPFVCIESDGDSCKWLAFTTVSTTGANNLGGSPFDRFEVTGFIEKPYGTLRDGCNFVQDYRKPITGPKQSFVTASQNENVFFQGRPAVESAKFDELVAILDSEAENGN